VLSALWVADASNYSAGMPHSRADTTRLTKMACIVLSQNPRRARAHEADVDCNRLPINGPSPSTHACPEAATCLACTISVPLSVMPGISADIKPHVAAEWPSESVCPSSCAITTAVELSDAPKWSFTRLQSRSCTKREPLPSLIPVVAARSQGQCAVDVTSNARTRRV
jgi:hypothetical protein